MVNIQNYPLETQPTKMSCGPATIANLLGYINPDNQDTMGQIIDQISLINHIGTTPWTYQSILQEKLNKIDLICSKHPMTREDLSHKIEMGIPVPCLILEASGKNPHGDSMNTEYNMHYVTVIDINDSHVTVANPFYQKPEILTKDEFMQKRGLSSPNKSTKANIFQTLGSIPPYTAFDISTKKSGLQFPDFAYLDYDRKQSVIEESMKEGTLGIGATTHQAREELFQDLANSPKNDISITMGTGGFFSRYNLQEIKHIENFLEKYPNKNIKEVFGGSGGSLAVVLWALDKGDEQSLNHLCNVPISIMKDWKGVSENSAYITASKMIPYLTDLTITANGTDIIYNKDELQDFTTKRFNEIFDEIMLYKAGGSLNITGGLIPEHIIAEIYKKIITQAYEKDNKILGDIDINMVNYSIKKITYQDIYENTGKDIGTLVALKADRGTYKTHKLNKDVNISVLDGIMGSSHLGKKQLSMRIGEKTFYLKDPYWTTKTTAEKEVHEMISTDSYHLALVTLNRFRLNPKDRSVKLGITKSPKERWHADGVLAPDFKKINSLNPEFIPEIDHEISKFLGEELSYDIRNHTKQKQ